MAQLAPGTGGPSDSQGGVLLAATYLENAVRSDIITRVSWSLEHPHAQSDSAPSYEPQWLFDGDNVINSASYSLNGFHLGFLGGTDHNDAVYAPEIEHNAAINDPSNLTLIQEFAIGYHLTLLGEYVQNFEHVNVENSIFNLDVLERGKKKPRYTWTTGSF